MGSKYEKPYPIDRPFLTIEKDPPRLLVRQATTQGYAVCPEGGVFDASYVGSRFRRGRVQGDGKVCPAVTVAAIETILIFEGITTKNTMQNERTNSEDQV